MKKNYISSAKEEELLIIINKLSILVSELRAIIKWTCQRGKSLI